MVGLCSACCSHHLAEALRGGHGYVTLQVEKPRLRDVMCLGGGLRAGRWLSPIGVAGTCGGSPVASAHPTRPPVLGRLWVGPGFVAGSVSDSLSLLPPSGLGRQLVGASPSEETRVPPRFFPAAATASPLGHRPRCLRGLFPEVAQVATGRPSSEPRSSARPLRIELVGLTPRASHTGLRPSRGEGWPLPRASGLLFLPRPSPPQPPDQTQSPGPVACSTFAHL